MSKRRNFKSEFKAKVAMEAIKGELTLAEISSKYEIHPNLISKWKKEAIKKMPGIFDGSITTKEKASEKEMDELYKKIGKLEVQLDFLKSRPGL